QSSIHRTPTRDSTSPPTRHTLQRLAAALGTTVPWLADGVHVAALAARPVAPHDNADGYSAELQALVETLPIDARKKVLAVVRLIAQGAGPENRQGAATRHR